MKITVIGSGSIFFTRQMVRGMAESEILRSAELALVDTHPGRCEQMGEFCKKLNHAWKGDLQISYTTDRTEALPGSDYVIYTFSRNNYHPRGVGAQICAKYGITVRSGDTAGPGMVFRTLKAVPEILEVTSDVEKLCPNALVLNVVNPTNIIAQLLEERTNVNSLSFCDGMYPPNLREIYCRRLGVEATPANWEKLDFQIGGVNHLTWMTGISYDGKQMWELFTESLEKEALEAGPSEEVYGEWQMTRIFGAYPTVFGHGAEYVPYFQGRGRTPELDHTSKMWNLNDRIRWWRSVWRNIADVNAGRIPPTDVLQDQSTDMLAGVIESIEGNLGTRFSVNVMNEGKIPNLPSDRVVEVWARFYNDGREESHKQRLEYIPSGPLPRGVLGITQRVMDVQAMALEAALTGEFRLVVRAIAADALSVSLHDAEAIAHEFMATDHEDLNEKWDGYWER